MCLRVDIFIDLLAERCVGCDVYFLPAGSGVGLLHEALTYSQIWKYFRVCRYVTISRRNVNIDLQNDLQNEEPTIIADLPM